MVFANLPHSEKESFFSLLDEYFQSRPELAAKLGSSSNSAPGTVNVDVRKAARGMASAASAFANSADSQPPAHARSPSSGSNPAPAPRGLVSNKRFGDVDTSSKMNMLTSSLLKTHQPAQPQPVQPPPSFGAPKNNFGPPPVRRGVPAAAEPEAEPEEEAQGEWAEALYDYDSTAPGDLQIRENQRVLVTERTSDDWWTGEFNGKTGLFPATYVKLL